MKMNNVLVYPRGRLHTVPQELMQAYLETEYSLQGSDAFSLSIGARSDGLKTAHQANRVSCSVFITADNPRSTQVSDADNEAAYQKLIAELDKRKLAWRAGYGRHPSGNWPPERSVLVMGLGRDGAAELGERFGQDAVVWSDEDAVPRLLVLRA